MDPLRVGSGIVCCLAMVRFRPFLIAGLLFVSRARADGADDKASADALFAEGRRLMASGSYAAACEKLSASQRLDPAIGTALSLADCFEKSGKLASAWAELGDVARTAKAAGQSERAAQAGSRAAELEGRLSRLTIKSIAVGVQVARDGKPVAEATIGVAVPIDAGRYTIQASAPGKKTWSQTIEIKAERESVTVEIPMLADGPTAPVPDGAPEPRRAEIDPGRGARGQRVLAVGVVAVGVAGIAVGTYSGLHAASLWADAKASCRSYPNGCGADAASLSQDAILAGNLSTVCIAVGIAGLAGGAALWFTAPRAPKRSAVAVGISPGAVVVGGTF
jgi:hypothetical protein